MAYVNVPEGPYTAHLVEIDKLTEDSLNPRDYIDFSEMIKIRHTTLSLVAKVKGEMAKADSVRRVVSGHVDRATGQVYEPMNTEENLNCLRFLAGNILFHKYRARIGRIGITEFDGMADSHFIVIRPFDIDNHYLLLALRSIPVLVQLPFRETTRPGVWNSDLETLQIPRLDDSTEDLIGTFIRRVFSLRKRASDVAKGLLDNFDKGVSSRMPTDKQFFLDVSEFSEETLDPGYYFMKVLEWTYPTNEDLDKQFKVIQPPSAKSGTRFTTVTIKDYEFEGIKPLTPKNVDTLPPKSFARIGDVILNKMHSKRESIAKATVIMKNLDYLEEVGLSVRKFNGETRVPVYSELFILRQKEIIQNSRISPYYLALMLNSMLFQQIFSFIMSGSTGRQRIRKEKMIRVKIPTLEDHIMKALSEATRVCLEIFSETLRMLIQLSRLYEKIVRGHEKIRKLTLFIEEENECLQSLEENAIEKAEEELLKTKGLAYAIEPVLNQ